MNKYINKELTKILISIIIFIISLYLSVEPFDLVLKIISYLIISIKVYKEALKSILNKEIFNEKLLMILATIGAFLINSSTEAIMVMLLYEIGEYLSDLAINKSKKNITELLNLRVDTINIVENNKIITKPTSKAKVSEIFIVKPGEKIPLDGIIIEGKTALDTKALTGEAKPKKVVEKDKVLSGSINLTSVIKVRTTSTYKTSTASKILNIIEKSEKSKTEKETIIKKIAKTYTKTVILISLSIILIPIILQLDYHDFIYQALVFLVSSCPCAIIISVPLSYFCGIGTAGKKGILVKGSKELEKASQIKYLFLDKTGTITEGTFKVVKVNPKKITEKALISIVANAEENSIHPIATAIKNYANTYKKLEVKSYREIPGRGLTCKIKDQNILIGNQELMIENSIEITDEDQDASATIIYIAIDNKYAGNIVITDAIKKSSYQINSLKSNYLEDIIILSGDNEQIVKTVSKKIKIDNYYGNLLPLDKVKKIKEYNKKGITAFIGDGINDAPALKTADLGISMGEIGTDAAIESSDIVIMHDNLAKVKEMIDISRRTNKIITQNIIFSLSIKLFILILSIFGISTMLMAVFADVGVTFITILNSLRVLYDKNI